MALNEAETRAKLIDPALHAKGWTEDLIRREETAGAVEVIAGQPRKRGGRADYTLRLPPDGGKQPTVTVALIEAKAAHLPPGFGLQQAKDYAKRLHVPFVYCSNGRMFVEYDARSGITQGPFRLSNFPGPEELRALYESIKGFSLDSEAASPLLQPYYGGESQRRYYQDAAIRATLEKTAAGDKRALLTMATGSGKTRIAVHLLKKIADAGQLRRALFVCDRDELRSQALGALQNVFGSDAAAASTSNPEKNARIVVATYQTLGVATDEDDATFLTDHYTENYFSHIIIDEAHRSAWKKWSQVLTRNPDAIQIGLTATPRSFEYAEDETDEARHDQEITADNVRYFGEPVYDYSIGQGIDDGYLAVMEIRKRDVFLEGYAESEKVTGIAQEDLEGKTLTDALTGEPRAAAEVRPRYEAGAFESQLVMPDRVGAMCEDLFRQLLGAGGPEQKTIIFCASDAHADAVANAMSNLHTQWRAKNGLAPVADYAFKCTAAAHDNHLLDSRTTRPATSSQPQWTSSQPAWMFPPFATSSSSGTSTLPSPSTRWLAGVLGSTPRPRNSCSASTITATHPAYSGRSSSSSSSRNPRMAPSTTVPWASPGAASLSRASPPTSPTPARTCSRGTPTARSGPSPSRSTPSA